MKVVHFRLDHPNITIALNTDYRDLQDEIAYRHMIYTGPIDEFFEYRYGKLPYRSLKFKHETHDRDWFQPNAVVNYTNEHLYTRITEFKYLTGQTHEKTSIVYEFPQADGDPYCPVPQPKNQELYKACKALADKMDVSFAGRLATYKYYNMDQVTGQALSVFSKRFERMRVPATTHGKTLVYPAYTQRRARSLLQATEVAAEISPITLQSKDETAA